jgi:hypothetical protein
MMPRKKLIRLATALLLAGDLATMVAAQGAAQWLFELGDYPGGTLCSSFA